MIDANSQLHSTTTIPLAVANDLKNNGNIVTVGDLVEAGPKGVIARTNEIGRRSLEMLADFVLYNMGPQTYKESGWDKWLDAV